MVSRNCPKRKKLLVERGVGIENLCVPTGADWEAK